MRPGTVAADRPVTGAFFRVAVASSDPGTEVLQPLPAGASGWSGDQIRGMAVSGALARATERTAEQALPGMRPTRWSVDLFRPARVRPTQVVPTVLRQGRRIGLIDAQLLQEGRPVARSRALFARPGSTPAGQVWRPERTALCPPPADLAPLDGERRLYYSDEQGWTARADAHQNGSRKQIWHLAMDLVEGEPPTAFQLAASVADVASLAVNWGTAGMEYINADIDLVLTRLPDAMELGLCAVDRTEGGGISTGTVLVFDRNGPLGRVTTVAVANPVKGVDPANRRPDLSAFAG